MLRFVWLVVYVVVLMVWRLADVVIVPVVVMELGEFSGVISGFIVGEIRELGCRLG